MLNDEIIPHTYVHLLVEVKFNPTESREKLEEILNHFLTGEVEEDIRSDGTYLYVQSTQENDLTILHEWILSQKILDTVRSRLLRSIIGERTAVYFNRQAAYMNHLSLVDLDDNLPLGAVVYNIVSDSCLSVIDILTPKTYAGRIMNELEKVKHFKRIERKKKLKKNSKDKQFERDKLLIEQDSSDYQFEEEK